MEKLKNEDLEKTEFYIVGKGRNNIVWGHPSYQHLVFKLMSQDLATKQIEVAQKALELTAKMKQCWIQIPRAISIPLETITAYIEERLPLALNDAQHQEFLARVLTHYQSAQSTEQFKTNLQKMVEQLQDLVEQLGFWDVGYHNLPEVNREGKGVCGTDFENIEPDPNFIATGLKRLTYLFPIKPLCDKITHAYLKALPDSIEFEQQIPQQTQAFYLEFRLFQTALNILQDVLERYDQGDIEEDRPISKVDFQLLTSLDENEKQLAQKLLNTIQEKQVENMNKKATLVEKRSIQLQPSQKWETDYTRERCLNILKTLQEHKIIMSYYDDDEYKQNENRINTENLNHTVYTIYY